MLRYKYNIVDDNSEEELDENDTNIDDLLAGIDGIDLEEDEEVMS